MHKPDAGRLESWVEDQHEAQKQSCCKVMTMALGGRPWPVLAALSSLRGPMCAPVSQMWDSWKGE